MKPGSRVVVALLVAIGLLDVVVGAWLLLAVEPWTAHGPGTVWLQAPALLEAHGDARPLLMSLFRRVGAFSLHAGVVTSALAIVGLRDRRVLTFVLAVWTVDGLAFFVTDRSAFAQTPYFMAKQAIGTLWCAAIAWHLYEGRRSTRATRAGELS